MHPILIAIYLTTGSQTQPADPVDLLESAGAVREAQGNAGSVPRAGVALQRNGAAEERDAGAGDGLPVQRLRRVLHRQR